MRKRRLKLIGFYTCVYRNPRDIICAFLSIQCNIISISLELLLLAQSFSLNVYLTDILSYFPVSYIQQLKHKMTSVALLFLCTL